MTSTTRCDALDGLGLRLVPAHEVDAAAVLRFESVNRDHFRRWIPDRGDDYYDLDAVAASLQQAERWWRDGSDRLHVVIDADGVVVARANLVEIADGWASVGYRVAAAHGGRGIATAALRDLLSAAGRWRIDRVRAVTSADNAGSARVLERCGFTLVGTREAALEQDGRMLDALDWEAPTTR